MLKSPRAVLILIVTCGAGRSSFEGQGQRTQDDLKGVAGMEAYSMDLRQRVIAACDGGLGIAEAARRFSLHRATIHRWLQRCRQTGSIASFGQHTGCKRKLDHDEHPRIAQLVKHDGHMTIAPLQTRLGQPVRVSTLGRVLRRVGITFKPRRSAPPSRLGPM